MRQEQGRDPDGGCFQPCFVIHLPRSTRNGMTSRKLLASSCDSNTSIVGYRSGPRAVDASTCKSETPCDAGQMRLQHAKHVRRPVPMYGA